MTTSTLPSSPLLVTMVPTWRFMGSYKWRYKSPHILVTLLITTHEPPSTLCASSTGLQEIHQGLVGIQGFRASRV